MFNFKKLVPNILNIHLSFSLLTIITIKKKFNLPRKRLVNKHLKSKSEDNLNEILYLNRKVFN